MPEGAEARKDRITPRWLDGCLRSRYAKFRCDCRRARRVVDRGVRDVRYQPLADDACTGSSRLVFRCVAGRRRTFARNGWAP